MKEWLLDKVSQVSGNSSQLRLLADFKLNLLEDSRLKSRGCILPVDDFHHPEHASETQTPYRIRMYVGRHGNSNLPITTHTRSVKCFHIYYATLQATTTTSNPSSNEFLHEIILIVAHEAHYIMYVWQSMTVNTSP